MSNLVAYIPVLNQRHVDWFARHPRSTLWLISQEMAEVLVPRLARNMGALSTEMQLEAISRLKWRLKLEAVHSLDLEQGDPNLAGSWKDWVMADEDISHAVYEKYYQPLSITPVFELIFARADMTSISYAHQVVPGARISTSEFDRNYMQQAVAVSGKSPDWWRQVGATLVCDGVVVASTCNEHMPTEYEVYMFGDPRINYDAGQPGKYVSLHAEQAVIAACAASPYSTQGSSLYVTTFPCEVCARQIAACNIARVFFKEGYSSLKAQEVLQSRGIEIIQVVNDPGSA